MRETPAYLHMSRTYEPLDEAGLAYTHGDLATVLPLLVLAQTRLDRAIAEVEREQAAGEVAALEQLLHEPPAPEPRPAAPVRVRRMPALTHYEPRWSASCRACWWHHTYPSHAVAVHAASQHVRHWLSREADAHTGEEFPF
jgi:hypothetical protein